MLRAALVCIGLLFGASALAADYGSVGKPGVVLYDGPSLNAEKAFVAPLGMPVELLSLIDQWVKARDQSGQSFWLLRTDLSPKRTLVVVRNTPVHASPSDDARIVFSVAEGVLLDLVEPTPVSGWARVRHATGGAGYVRSQDVWGL